jgi:hypothetical protein
MQWVTVTLSLYVKWHGREAGLSPTVRMLKAVHPFPYTPPLRVREDFTFLVYLILKVANFVSEISKSTELYDNVRSQNFSV